jgi:hypothetical protein
LRIAQFDREVQPVQRASGLDAEGASEVLIDRHTGDGLLDFRLRLRRALHRCRAGEPIHQGDGAPESFADEFH